MSEEDRSELTEEETNQVLHAARGGILDLISENPALAIRFGEEDLVKVYLAGVVAGVDATVRVFKLVGRYHEEGEL